MGGGCGDARRGEYELEALPTRARSGAAGHAAALENGSRGLAGHLPLHHLRLVARRAQDPSLALGGAHTRNHRRGGSVDGLPAAPRPPASLGSVVTSASRPCGQFWAYEPFGTTVEGPISSSSGARRTRAGLPRASRRGGRMSSRPRQISPKRWRLTSPRTLRSEPI